MHPYRNFLQYYNNTYCYNDNNDNNDNNNNNNNSNNNNNNFFINNKTLFISYNQ